MHWQLQSRSHLLQTTGMAELSRKRKADSFAGGIAEPEAKKGRTLYETTIAAPFRRARRSLVCMHKVSQSYL